MLNQLFQRNRGGPTQPAPVFSSVLGDDDIHVTGPALAKLRELMANADDDFAGIRLFVMGGGCGGMNYSMTYAEQVSPLDTVLENKGLKLIVDAVALNYLRGCTIDYSKQGLNENFVFKDVFQSIGGSGGCAGCGAAGASAY